MLPTFILIADDSFQNCHLCSMSPPRTEKRVMWSAVGWGSSQGSSGSSSSRYILLPAGPGAHVPTPRTRRPHPNMDSGTWEPTGGMVEPPRWNAGVPPMEAPPMWFVRGLSFLKERMVSAHLGSMRLNWVVGYLYGLIWLDSWCLNSRI